MGAEITDADGEIVCFAHELRGAHIQFPIPSVGATENAMLAACAAKGETIIENAAREPEIVDLQEYLYCLGAKISGAGTEKIVISGFSPEKRVGHRIIPDRIVCATLLCAAAATGGDVELRGVHPEHFSTVTHLLSEAGCAIMTTGRSTRLVSDGCLRGVGAVSTGPYPGFPTDAQPLLMAALLKAKGTTDFTENIFENRFRYVQELRRFGADVAADGRHATLTGVDSLLGASVTAADLRGGAAMILAGLAAEGETSVYDGGYVARGYDGLDGVLQGLGADIRFET
jgi:UDP-N-acetylglucosamine 1-carboxyvinyltransferase